MNDASLPRPPARVSFATILAFVGLLAIAGGWSAAWVSGHDVAGAGISRSELERLHDQAKKKGASGAAADGLGHLTAGENVSGHELVAVVRFSFEHATGLDGQERRGWSVGLAMARFAPFVAGLVALLLALARLRKPSSPVVALVLFVATCVLGLLGIVGLGASPAAQRRFMDDPGTLGIGLYAVAAGSVLALVGGLFAVRTTTWWKAYLLAFFLVAGGIAGIFAYVGTR